MYIPPRMCSFGGSRVALDDDLVPGSEGLLCYAMLCYAMLGYATLHYNMLYYDITHYYTMY